VCEFGCSVFLSHVFQYVRPISSCLSVVVWDLLNYFFQSLFHFCSFESFLAAVPEQHGCDWHAEIIDLKSRDRRLKYHEVTYQSNKSHNSGSIFIQRVLLSPEHKHGRNRKRDPGRTQPASRLNPHVWFSSSVQCLVKFIKRTVCLIVWDRAVVWLWSLIEVVTLWALASTTQVHYLLIFYSCWNLLIWDLHVNVFCVSSQCLWKAPQRAGLMDVQVLSVRESRPWGRWSITH